MPCAGRTGTQTRQKWLQRRLISSRWCAAMFDRATMNNAQQGARAFRIILNAMARPGKVFTLPSLIEQSGPAYATTLTVLLALGDHLTSIYLAEAFCTAEIEKLLRFHTASQLVEDRAQADFAILNAANAEMALGAWSRGNPEYPDQSATLLIQTTSLAQGQEVQFWGPGIQSPITVHIADINPSFWKARAAANATFPLGVDMIFVTSQEILGCPRSTHVSFAGDI